MVPDWFFEWAKDHCLAFGFRERDAETVVAWGPVLSAMLTAAELRSATGHLLSMADAPRFAADHRAALIRAVENVRRKATAATASSAPTGCGVCGGGGVVIVPHPGLDDNGRWRPVLLLPDADPQGLTRTAGVFCPACEAGRRSIEGGRPSLTQYEHRYPYWREVQFEREQVLKAGRTPPSAEDVARLNRLLEQTRKRAG